MIDDIATAFPRGLLRQELFLGVVTGVAATQARLSLTAASRPSGSHFEAARYGRGEVGELVLIEGQVGIVLGRLVDVRVPDGARQSLDRGGEASVLDVSGFVQFLGTVQPDTLRVAAGVACYPRLGDRAYAAPHSFVAKIPQLMANLAGADASVQLELGRVSGNSKADVSVRPEKLFGRHCAVLGATGGGKSWTLARLLEQSARHRSKCVLLDATSEYRNLGGPISHFHLGEPVERAGDSRPCSIPPSSFQESDFIALFEPSGKVQGPKLREAIRSLRLVAVEPTLADQRGCLLKARQPKLDIERAMKTRVAVLEDPSSIFDASLLARQLMEECVFPDDLKNPGHWGSYSDADKSFCLPLASRAHAIVRAPAFAPVFAGGLNAPLSTVLSEFLDDESKSILRICLGGVSYEYRARQFIVNAIGRLLLTEARKGTFTRAPLIAFVDEAHNFLGHSVGSDDAAVRMDAFELIAREGRKYGLNICLATQRPRDLTEGVLSQIGTLIVHRLTNDRDREIVERACGEIDRAATAFLANLRQGEAAVIGVDFPIPITVAIGRPATPPASDGPDYQVAWRRVESPAEGTAQGAESSSNAAASPPPTERRKRRGQRDRKDTPS